MKPLIALTVAAVFVATHTEAHVIEQCAKPVVQHTAIAAGAGGTSFRCQFPHVITMQQNIDRGAIL